MKVRIASFNCENLFARYNFKAGREALAADGFTRNDLAFTIHDDTTKRITALAIREVKADIICLQEVEDLTVLERFNQLYCGRVGYKYRILIDSHDPRFIDVAVLSKFPFAGIRTYRHERNKRNSAWLFSRDCLEVDIQVADNLVLTAYVNHFKSMMEGRSITRNKRLEQTAKVAEIIDSRWKSKNYRGNFVVLGDFNDYAEGNTGLAPLLDHPGLVNTTEGMPDEEKYTHYWAGGNRYHQLDYILISRKLAAANTHKAQVMRKGLPFRAKKYTGPRFPGIGMEYPKASDHAPIYMDLTLG